MNASVLDPSAFIAFTAAPPPPRGEWRDFRAASRHSAVMRGRRAPERSGTRLLTVAEARPALADFDGDY
jgi:hypothetical protein